MKLQSISAKGLPLFKEELYSIACSSPVSGSYEKTNPNMIQRDQPLLIVLIPMEKTDSSPSFGGFHRFRSGWIGRGNFPPTFIWFWKADS
jgi:hypothetical protein